MNGVLELVEDRKLVSLGLKYNTTRKKELTQLLIFTPQFIKLNPEILRVMNKIWTDGELKRETGQWNFACVLLEIYLSMLEGFLFVITEGHLAGWDTKPWILR